MDIGLKARTGTGKLADRPSHTRLRHTRRLLDGLRRFLAPALRGESGPAPPPAEPLPVPPAAHDAQLLAMVAHEMRSPLGAMQAALALLERGVAESSLEQARAVLGRQLRHLTHVVDDLTDVEAARTGQLRVAFGRFRVQDAIHEVLESCHPALGSRRQDLVLQAMPPADCFIDGDAVRLKQIIVNLLDNASKYTPEGGEITLSVVVDGAAVTITVRDDGIGIAPELLSRMFEPFVREPRAARFQPDGLGLGLTLVRDLVAAHRGRVQATSEGPGRGSCFVVELPGWRGSGGPGLPIAGVALSANQANHQGHS